ncbi:MAG TPA: methyl-accepting chemotaxis protein [Clostridia bacterium]|mgnify:CR=1 FL=1
MRNKKKLEKISDEALSIRNHTRQILSGNLDIKVDAEHFTFLKELAEDIDQINSTFNAYINEITHILSHLSAGNMTVAFSEDVSYKGDFLPIRNALHKIKHSLSNSFGEIYKLSTEIDAMSSKVEDGSSFLAANTTEQAALISDLTSTVYDITDKTMNNAANAKEAAKAIEAIAKETETGRLYMDQMLSSVDKVRSSIDDISHIIGIINEIAEQTKLLALNAAIEAARAGVNGQGFSVVAGEIGKLAQKSSEAVRQTAQLINNGIVAAGESAKIAKKTAESFESINSSIEGAAGLCNEIAELSNTQAENLRETSAIVANISEAVQGIAAYAQENSAGAMNLSGISAQLKKVLQRFRLAGQENAKSADVDTGEESIRELAGKLTEKLIHATTAQAADKILENEIRDLEDVECLYVISGNGRQLSHTIMNPRIMVEQDENFKPALPGEDYNSKKYFRQALKNRQELYISQEYISKATGNLCRTISYAYQGIDNEYYVLCIDLLCRF